MTMSSGGRKVKTNNPNPCFPCRFILRPSPKKLMRQSDTPRKAVSMQTEEKKLNNELIILLLTVPDSILASELVAWGSCINVIKA